MNDTHNHEQPDTDSTSTGSGGDAIDEIAAVDPADAPAIAERYALDLAAELEESGASTPDPVQLQADLDTNTGPDAS